MLYETLCERKLHLVRFFSNSGEKVSSRVEIQGPLGKKGDKGEPGDSESQQQIGAPGTRGRDGRLVPQGKNV